MYRLVMVSFDLSATAHFGYCPLADLGGVLNTRPLRDPIRLFSHTFSPKSACVEGPCPLTGPHPSTGNPGSTTAVSPRQNPRQFFPTKFFCRQLFVLRFFLGLNFVSNYTPQMYFVCNHLILDIVTTPVISRQLSHFNLHHVT